MSDNSDSQVDLEFVKSLDAKVRTTGQVRASFGRGYATVDKFTGEKVSPGEAKELLRILGPDYDITKHNADVEAPPWLSARKEITNNELQVEPPLVEGEPDMLRDEEDMASAADDMPWWSDEQ